MSDLRADVFAEDMAHEQFIAPLTRRVGTDEGVDLEVHVRSARGGRAKALKELERYLGYVDKGLLRAPDLLVVALDANCRGLAEMHANINAALGSRFDGRAALACPDPHIERWYMADAASFAQVIGIQPPQEKRKCERDRYKRQLVETIRSAGQVTTLGGPEFGLELADVMDLYRAARQEPSLGSFLDGVRAVLHGLGRQRGEG